MGDTQPPTLDYESTTRKPWTLADLRHGWPALLLLAFVLLMNGLSAWRQHAQDRTRQAAQLAQEKRVAALQLAEKQYNARVAPLLQADPRFYYVSKVGEAGYITNSIAPTGVVGSAADREALRAVLQNASPPMPLNMQFVLVSPSAGAATRASRAGDVRSWHAGDPPLRELKALDEFQKRVAPPLE
jgi:hypothetical protein